MNWFARLSERWRSLPAPAVLLAAFLLLAGLGIIFLNERTYRAQKVSQSRVEAEILAASVSAPLDFNDGRAAQEATDALRVNPEVRSAAIYDRNGTLFAGFARHGVVVPPSKPGKGSDPGRSVAVSVPVASGNEQVGTVHIVSEREPVSRRLTRYSIITLFVVMAALVVIVLGISHSALRRINRQLELRAGELSDANQELTVQIEERARAEEQLRQAQKMQALGQLTGGIAHDFNNLLTVIQGSADILQRPNLSEEKRNHFAGAISQTAARAAALTSQLLSFARRQPLRPETMDLNEHILGMVDLLDRTLGERIVIRTELSSDACVVDVDPAQLESAILNVAVNARDAMESAGEGDGALTIKTLLGETLAGGVPAVALTIVDTGGGIEPEALARVFEPFFTTKEVGRGTGLGLSQVYGFATQSGGDVRIESVMGEGTTVTLLLPCSEMDIVPAGMQWDHSALLTSKTGRILVVDDNEAVGAFAEALLIELGHRVIRANSGEQALAFIERFPVDAVFTDIVMPGIGGLELAERLGERFPGLPIILTTGYSDQIEGDTAKRLPILFKPYKLEAVAQALDRAISGVGSTA